MKNFLKIMGKNMIMRISLRGPLGNVILSKNERYYIPSEISWLLKTLKFKTINIFGAKLGAFSRDDRLTTEDFEMLVVADK